MSPRTLTRHIRDFGRSSSIIEFHIPLIIIGIVRVNLSSVYSDRGSDRFEHRSRFIERCQGIIGIDSRSEFILVHEFRNRWNPDFTLGRESKLETFAIDIGEE